MLHRKEGRKGGREGKEQDEGRLLYQSEFI